MKDRFLQELADKLYLAERDRVAIPPLTEFSKALTLDDAYAIQLKNIDRVTAMGYKISGKKIGLTSPGIQQQLGVNEPDFGHLFASMDCREGKIDTTQLIAPKIEAELAFVLGDNLTGGNVSAMDVRKATKYVVGAFEIVDSRVADWKIKLADTVADNASSGRYILGKKRLKVDAVELPSEHMILYKNGEKVQEGIGANVMGDPCVAVAWLANCLWGFGVPFKKGEVILSGAFSAAPAAVKGDVFRVEFKSFGTIDAEFV